VKNLSTLDCVQTFLLNLVFTKSSPFRESASKRDKRSRFHVGFTLSNLLTKGRLGPRNADETEFCPRFLIVFVEIIKKMKLFLLIVFLFLIFVFYFSNLLYCKKYCKNLKTRHLHCLNVVFTTNRVAENKNTICLLEYG